MLSMFSAKMPYPLVGSLTKQGIITPRINRRNGLLEKVDENFCFVLTLSVASTKVGIKESVTQNSKGMQNDRDVKKNIDQILQVEEGKKKEKRRGEMKGKKTRPK